MKNVFSFQLQADIFLRRILKKKKKSETNVTNELRNSRRRVDERAENIFLLTFFAVFKREKKN